MFDVAELGWSSRLVFIAYFLIYALEYFFPLVSKKSRHLLANLSMGGALLLVNLAFTSLTFAVTQWAATEHVGVFYHVHLPLLVEVLVGLLVMDLWAGYVSHVIFHKFESLWRLHVVHHSDDLVDVTTSFRQHPVESIIKILFNLTGVLALGLPPWFLVLYLTLSTLQSQFEHANLRLPDRLDQVLQYVLVTPNMHKVHHSKYQHETDSNFSNIFSFWDRLFNTYKKKENYNSIEYGLDFLPEKTRYTFWQLIKYPFSRSKN